MPKFSIVIPVYNRERLVGRAIESCLKQDFDDFEIIIVDDASTDGSVQAIKRFSDPRIKLICHQTNRGVCPARNTAVDAAAGEWLIFLDSDDELLPGALSEIYRTSQSAACDVGKLMFAYKHDDGGFTPDYLPEEDVIDFEGWIRWQAEVPGRHDVLDVVRKSTFEQVRFPDNRATEMKYNLDFADKFKSQASSSITAVAHNDANNRYTQKSVDWLLGNAAAEADCFAYCLKTYGQRMRKVSRKAYLDLLRSCSAKSIMAGRRMLGLKYVVQYIKSRPSSPSAWIMIPIAILGPKTCAWVSSKRAAVVNPIISHDGDELTGPQRWGAR